MKNIHTIGVPRGLLTYRDGILWKEFFTQLGFSYILSPRSDRSILEEGTARRGGRDLSSPLRCIWAMYSGCWENATPLFYPPGRRIHSPGKNVAPVMNPLPDLIANIFRRRTASPSQTVSYDWYDKTNEEAVYLKLAETLGKTKKEGKKGLQQRQKKYRTPGTRQKKNVRCRSWTVPKARYCWPVILSAAS